MKNELKLEIKKALCNKYFLISAALGCLLALASAVYMISSHFLFIQQDYAAEFQEMSTLYNTWLGGDYQSLGASLYYFLFPLLASLPFGWSYCEEHWGNYSQKIIMKIGRGSYMAAKYIATFISGGLAMLIPLCFNLLVTAMFVPAIKPYVLDDIYYGVFGGSLMADMYYTHPLLRVFIYMVISFVFCGLLACFSLSAGVLIRYRIVCLAAPMLLCMGIHFGSQFIYVNPGVIYKEISPFYFLRACDLRLSSEWAIIIIEILILMAVSAAAGVIACRRDYV